MLINIFNFIPGHGEYGEVFLAKAKGITDTDSEVVVMVKALQTRDENAHFEYKREMDMLNKLHHDNIAKLLGMCRESEPFLFITEYSDWVGITMLNTFVNI